MIKERNDVNESAISAVEQWVKQVVIEENFCPFAKPVEQNGSICYVTTQSNTLETALMHLIVECERLSESQQYETTLLIFDKNSLRGNYQVSASYIEQVDKSMDVSFDKGFKIFDDFLDLMSLADDLIVEQGYEGVFQLAHFHPHYCFDGCDEQDAENYTNRSPFPILHLLRESSVEQGLKSISLPENIPNRNIRHARKKGRTFWQSKLKGCFKTELKKD